MEGMLFVGKLLTMGLGLLIALRGFQGYRRNESEPMLFVGVGFVFLTFGGIMGCSFIRASGMAPGTLGVVQTGLVATGMGFVLYSLYG
ncbi:DUF7521 family protein [Halorussus halophilus]|uniref:DUF7521 family protein n=1 Tax=Halorussus halophilus TaxID=2650975 RepID=UPI0013015C77|nr:hypothetical protein [Halorussus halophilus]